MDTTVKQIIINAQDENPKGVNNEDSNLSGVIPITIDSENGINAAEIYQVDLFKKILSEEESVVRVAIQGEPGLRFSFFPVVVDPLEMDTEKNLDDKIENACVTMSSIGVYEIDSIGFNLHLDSLYVYLPKNKRQISKNIYIDLLCKIGGKTNE